jgi:hypothetical protein
MKSTLRFLLLAFWLFALTAPSVLTLLDSEKPLSVTNPNEGEQEEFALKCFDEQKLVNASFFDIFLLSSSEKKQSINDDFFICLDYTLEIILPPPEYLG